MSIFLQVPPSQWIASNEYAFAIRDQFPVSVGHTLVITRRVVPDWFSATDAERAAVMELVARVKQFLDDEQHPDGYNVGFNAGLAAGQTVMHLHMHVIPRFVGDMDDPSGGVRHVIPTKGNYKRAIKPLSSGGTDDPFSRHIFPLFNAATEITIVAAFIQETGLDLIESHVRSAVDRGARVRILTGDYLDITQASALELLLSWEQTTAAEDDDVELPVTARGSLEGRIIEVAKLPGLTRAFHPKAWRFEAQNFGIAFVGSSNLSRSALQTGIEWNLRVDRDRDSEAYTRVREAFESLWSGGRALDAGWIADYARRARLSPHALPPGETEAEALTPAPPAHVVQLEALAKLREARQKGWRRALVVLATGLGKTWLAAFDHQQLREEMGAPPRLLFLAHRKELLTQAAQTYRRALQSNGHHARVGWCLADQCDLSADLVFASVSKLARPEHVAKLVGQRFDYVVVDEVHHAAAKSYRTILNALDVDTKTSPRFILGLTATPDRADSRDILGLFDDHTAYSAGVERGVEIERLVPFHYFGVKDDIDYANIPWRNRRFDPEKLAAEAQTEARMATMWRAWGEHTGTRTLLFCCSIAHANFVRSWLTKAGVRTRAVYSGEGSDDRDDALRDLESGAIDALCSVDVFNEGVDVPTVDRVVMLRPTESSVIFLQQLGRGLRAASGKTAVTVIDFVGNHRIFLERLRALLSLGGRDRPEVRPFLESNEPLELPSGCSVELALEAKNLLASLFKNNGADEIENTYRELRLERGERPSAGEMERMGYPPSRLRRDQRHAGWFDFVNSEDDLEPEQKAVFTKHDAFLRELETTEMNKCFKMITLDALIEANALREGLPLRDLAVRSHAILRRSPELFAEVAHEVRKAELDVGAEKKWVAYWHKNPIDAWTAAKKVGRTWFRIDGDRFLPAFTIDLSDEATLAELTRELVDYRLAQYRGRQQHNAATPECFVCRVTWNQRDPIIRLPSRAQVQFPEGDIDVRVDGAVWQFRLARQFCNVARRAGSPRNQLPDLLRGWFGPSAGKPGTAFDVRFERSPDGWWAEPVNRNVIDFPARRGVIAYPDLRAAAGHAMQGSDTTQQTRVMLPVEQDNPEVFAVRVSGTSMDGGKAPMRDGDWAVMRLARSAPVSAMEDRVVLIELPGSQYQIKRLRKVDGHWRLASDNPSGPTFDASEDTVAIARLDQVIHPEDLGPAIGTVLSEAELPAAFGLSDFRARSGRNEGHLFIFIDHKGVLVAPDRVRFAAEPQRAGETAFVLSLNPNGSFRYLGVGRWREAESCWQIPDVDFSTWRNWGEGREASRALPEGALARAQLVADKVLELPAESRWLEQPNGNRARVLGPAARGGLRVDGGDGGFNERTVSLNDLAWVVVADDAAKSTGALLDEVLVNRGRYLEGTPKGSTRYIDTAWALAVWRLGKGLVTEATGGATQVRKLRRANGKPVDASFSVEPVGEHLSVIVEARGGTSGTKDERNTDYAPGLELLLERLAAKGLKIADAVVESKDTLTLPIEKRRLHVAGRPYPITLDDVGKIRRALSAAQAKVGRKPGAKGGGNSTKRIRLTVDTTVIGPEELAKLLEGPA